MNTPHHQINIHHTQNDRHNPGDRLRDDRHKSGGNLPNDRHNPGDRLPVDRHNPVVPLPIDHHNFDSHLPDDRHYLSGGVPDDRHYLGGRIPDGRRNLDGRQPNDRHYPGGRLHDDRHNPGGRIDGRQVSGHRNALYNDHHVKESLTTRVSKLICAVFLSILFTAGLVMFILWLSLRPHHPWFHIHEFSMPNLADPNGFSTARIIFNVTARNPNLDIGIFYDIMNLTIYYQDQTIAETPLLFPFYQSPKNTAIIYGTLSGPTLRIDRARWLQLFAARKRGAVPLRVDVASLIRFKVSAWDSRHHKMHANCEIGVGSNGMILGSDKEKKCPVYFT